MNEHFDCVALLPMKAHSARVSGKNFRDFSGKPLFRWVLDTLLSVDAIDLIVINTDARDILKSHGLPSSSRILVRDRKEHLCGDMVSMNSVLQDDVHAINAKTYLMTHTTNPLLSKSTICSAIAEYRDGIANDTCDSLFSCNEWQTRFYRADGSAVNHDPDNLIRTQDLEPWYEENSNLYLFSRESFEQTNARIGKRPKIFTTPRMESFDIDDQDGWDLAEIVRKHLWQVSYDRLAANLK